jgi:hypothetical protein
MTTVTAACQQLTGGLMLVVERTARKERYGQAPSSASHPTLEAGAPHRRSGAEEQSAPTGAAEKTREVSSARAEGVGCCVLGLPVLPIC